MEQVKFASKFISQTEIGKGEPIQETQDGGKSSPKQGAGFTCTHIPLSSTVSATSRKGKSRKQKKMRAYQTKPAYTPEYQRRLSDMMKMETYYTPVARKLLDSTLQEKIMLTLGKKQYELEKDLQIRDFIKAFKVAAVKKPEAKIVFKHRQYITDLVEELPRTQDVDSKSASDETLVKSSLDNFMDEWLKDFHPRSIYPEPESEPEPEPEPEQVEDRSFLSKMFGLFEPLEKLRAPRYTPEKVETKEDILQFGDYKKSAIRSRTAVKKRRVRPDKQMSKPEQAKPVPESRFMMLLRKKMEQQKKREREAAKPTKLGISRAPEPEVEKTIILDTDVKTISRPSLVKLVKMDKKERRSTPGRKLSISKETPDILVPEKDVLSFYRLPSTEERRSKVSVYKRISWPSPMQFLKQILGLRVKDKLVATLGVETKKDLLLDRLHGGNPSLMLEIIKQVVGKVTGDVFLLCIKDFEVSLNEEKEKEVLKKINIFKTNITNYLINELRHYVYGEGALCTAEEMATKVESILEIAVAKMLYGLNYRAYDSLLEEFMMNSKLLSIVDENISLADIESFISNVLSKDSAQVDSVTLSLKDTIYNNLKEGFKDVVVDSQRLEDVEALIDKIMLNSFDELIEKQGGSLEGVEGQLLLKMRSLRSSISKLNKEFKEYIESEGVNCTPEKIQEQMENILFRVVNKVFYEKKDVDEKGKILDGERAKGYETRIDESPFPDGQSGAVEPEVREGKPRLGDIPLVIDHVMKNMLKERLEKLGVDSGKLDLKQLELMKNELLREVNDFIRAQGENCTMDDIVSKIKSCVHKTMHSIKPRLEDIPLVIDHVVKNMLKEQMEKLGLDSGKVDLKQLELMKNELLREVNDFIRAQGEECTMDDIVSKIESSVRKTLYSIKPRLEDIPLVIDHVVKNMLKEQMEKLGLDSGKVDLKQLELMKNELLREVNGFIQAQGENWTMGDIISKIESTVRKTLFSTKPKLEDIPLVIDHVVKNMLKERMEKLGLGSGKVDLKQLELMKNELLREVNGFIQAQGENWTMGDIISKIESTVRKTLFSTKPKLEDIPLVIDRVVKNMLKERLEKLGLDSEKLDLKQLELMKNDLLREVNDFIQAQGEDITMDDIVSKIESCVRKTMYSIKPRSEDIPLVIDHVMKNMLKERLETLGVDSGKVDLKQLELMRNELLREVNDFIQAQGENCTVDDIISKIESTVRKTLFSTKPKLEDIPLVIDHVVKNMLKERLEKLGLDSEKVDLKQLELMKNHLLREINDFIRAQGENCTLDDIVSIIESCVRKTLFSTKPKLEDIPLVIDHVVKNMLKERLEKLGLDSEKVDLKQLELMKNHLLREINNFIRAQGENCTLDDIVSKIDSSVRKTLYNIKPRLEDIPIVIDHVVKNMLKERLEKLGVDSRKVLFKKYGLIRNQLPATALVEINDFIRTQDDCTMEDIVSKIEVCVGEIMDGVFGELHEIVHGKLELKQKVSREQVLKELRTSFKNRVDKNVKKEIKEYFRKSKAKPENLEAIIGNIRGMVDRAMNEVLDHYVKDLDVPLVVMGEKQMLNKMDILRGNLTANIIKELQDYIEERGDFVTTEEIMSKVDNTLDDAMAMVFDRQQEGVFANFLDKLLYYSRKLGLTEEEKEKILQETKEQTKKELRTNLKSRIGKNLKKEFKKHVRKSLLHVQNSEKVFEDIQCMIDRVMTDGVGTCLTDLDIPAARAGDEQILDKVDASRRKLALVVIRKVNDLILKRIMYRCTADEFKNQLGNIVDVALSMIFDEGENTDLDVLLDELVLQATKKEISEEKPETLRPLSVEGRDIGVIKDGKHSALLHNPVFLQTLYNKIDELLEADKLASKEDKSKLKAFIAKSIPVKYDDLRKETTMDDILAQRGFHRCVKPVKDVLKEKRREGEGVTIKPTPRIATPRKKRQPVQPIIEETVKETIKSFLPLTKKQSRGSKIVSVPMVCLEIFSEDKTDDILLPENSIFDSEELRIFMKSLTVGKSYTKAKQSIAKKLSCIVPLPQKVLESVIDGCARGSSVVKMCSSA